jgi:hypothetical protein
MPEEEKKISADPPAMRERSEHPWIEMPMDESAPDEVLRYSLDEIRF